MFWPLFFLQLGLGLIGASIDAWLRARKPGPDAQPFTKPNVTPGTSITALFGTRRVPLIWTLMAPAQTEDIKQQVGSEFFGLIPIVEKVGKRYFITGQAVLCWGAVTELRNIVFGPNTPLTDLDPTFPFLREFRIDNNLFGPPDVTIDIEDVPRLSISNENTHKKLALYAPTVFGGEENNGGGGVSALIGLYSGDGQDGPSALLESIVGPGNMPTYRELAYTTWNHAYVGTRPTMPSIDFIVTALPFNSPVSGLGELGGTAVNTRTILSRSALRVLTGGGAAQWTASDVSPIYVAIALLIHRMYGLGRNPEEYDLNNWNDASVQVRGEEGIGVSVLLVGAKQSARTVIGEMFEIAGVVPLRNPETNKIQLKLIREESIDTMREFGPSEIIEADLTKQLLQDTKNEVTLYYSDAEKLYDQDFVTVRDRGNVAATGTIRPIAPIRYLSVTERRLAIGLAIRALKPASLELHSGTIKCTRAAWDVERGDVCKFEIPWLDFDDEEGHFGKIVLRVTAVNLGHADSNVVTLTVVEDVFGKADPVVEVVDTPTVPPIGTTVLKRSPQIVPTQRQDSTTGYLDLVIADPDLTVTKVEAATSVGGATPSDFVELTGPPYEESVALSSAGQSRIAWRVTYDRGGGGATTVGGTVTFAALPIGAGPGVEFVTTINASGDTELVFSDGQPVTTVS